MSEALKYTVVQNFTEPYLTSGVDHYTAGLLTLGYLVAWSSLMKRLGNYTEPASFRQAEPVV
jgi:hypothetical protein